MKKKILKTIGILSILVLFGKALGWLREVLISYRFGAGYISDVYVFEDGFVNALNSIFSSIISTTFIPIYIKMKSDEKNKYISNIFSIFGFIICLLIILCEIFTIPILKGFAPGFFNLYNMTEVILVTRIMLITVLFVFIENVLIAIFQANEYYYFSALQSIILNVSLLIFLVFGYKFGIIGIIVTKVISHIIILISLYTIINKKRLYNPKLIFDSKDENIKKMFKLSLPVLIVSMISQLNYIVDRIMSSMLNSGSMTLVSYSTTITMLPYYVIGYAVNSTFFTEVSRVQDDSKKMNEVLMKHLEYLNKTIIPTCIVLVLFSTQIGYIMYGRGNMTENNIITIGKLIVFYIPGIYMLCIRDLLNRICYTIQKTYLMSISTIIGFIINIVLNIILVKTFGIYGLAIATTFGSFISTFLIYFLLVRGKYIKLSFNFSLKRIIRYIISILIAFILKKIFKYIIINELITYLIEVIISFIIIFSYNNFKEIKQIFEK